MNAGDPFVPKSDYDILQSRLSEAEHMQEQLNAEVLQLREVIKKLNSGIHKASEEPISTVRTVGNVDMPVRVDDWRRCREIAMDLLHIPMQTNLDLIIKLEDGYLRGITQKERHQ